VDPLLGPRPHEPPDRAARTAGRPDSPLAHALGPDPGLLDLSASRLPTRTEIETLIARQALYQFIGEAELGRAGDTASGPVRRGLHAIDDGLSTAVDLDRVAEAAAVSRPHLVRLFRREVGQTPSAYAWARRAERGVHLLEETGPPVDEVVRRSGFRTTQHFSRRVKAATGTSPAQVRRQAWGTGGPPSTPRLGGQVSTVREGSGTTPSLVP
jgi:AraC family transcriptional regulator of arabinose operon